jgi:2TM domain
MASNTEFEHPNVKQRSESPSDEFDSSAQLDERSWARVRVERKQKFRSDVVAYVCINAFLVSIWAFSGHGYFWPGWVLGGWAVGLLLDGWNLFYRKPITDADVDRELRRRNG